MFENCPTLKLHMENLKETNPEVFKDFKKELRILDSIPKRKVHLYLRDYIGALKKLSSETPDVTLKNHIETKVLFLELVRDIRT